MVFLALILTIILFFPTVTLAGNVETKQYDLDSEPKDLIWCGPNRDIVLIVTEMDSLYKSEDKGFTWKKLNDIITNTGKATLEENENEVFFTQNY
jgi:hypothetical protein